ncbi:hypothetical protein DL93DRAFT_1104431 [Clavulina sp. PMI_390]|nr:hypothetical protein DL93DRAFT_1104431 [Clavulina sp. PMI_390]
MPSFSSAEAFHRPASSNTNDIGSRSSRPIRQRISLGFSRSFSSANSLSSISNSTRTTSTKSISTKSLKFKNSSSLWSSVSQVFTRSVGSRLVKAQELSMKISPTLALVW